MGLGCQVHLQMGCGKELHFGNLKTSGASGRYYTRNCCTVLLPLRSFFIAGTLQWVICKNSVTFHFYFPLNDNLLYSDASGSYRKIYNLSVCFPSVMYKRMKLLQPLISFKLRLIPVFISVLRDTGYFKVNLDTLFVLLLRSPSSFCLSGSAS